MEPLLKYREKDKIGAGAEGEAFKSTNEKYIIKERKPLDFELEFFNKKIRLLTVDWQSDWEEFYEKCGEGHERSGIPYIQFELRKDVVKILETGEEIVTEGAKLITPFIPNLEERIVNVTHFYDPEVGPEVIKQSFNIVKQADLLKKEMEVGYDAYGFDSLYTALSMTRQKALLSLAKICLIPEKIRSQISKLCPGIIGTMSNMVFITEDIAKHFKGIPENYFENEETKNKPLIGSIDIGMHDLSDNSKTPFLTKMMNDLTYAGLIQLVKQANESQLDEKLSYLELKELEGFYEGNWFHRQLSIWFTKQLPIMAELAQSKT